MLVVIVLKDISCAQTKYIEIKKSECYNYITRIYLLLVMDQ